MKDKRMRVAMLVLCMGVLGMTGCGKSSQTLEEPPEEVLHPEAAAATGDTAQNDIAIGQDGESTEHNAGQNDGGAGSGSADILSGAVVTKIGLNDTKEYTIDMYNNAAANTILGYLSESEMRFPAYTYNAEEGYVAQNVRGAYTRDDETDVTAIHKGELYLFSDGQLRLYFQDIENAGITATPIGYFADDISGLVEKAYEENRDDSWGVDVYFLIRTAG